MSPDETTEGDKPEGDGAPAPKYITAEDFNRGATAREKKLVERLEKSFEEKLTKILAARQQTPEAEGTSETDEDASKSGDHASAGAASTDATSKQIASLQRQLTREKNEREKREAADREKDAKIARDEERTKLSEALVTAGVDPKKIRGALALLHTEDKRVRRNADGKVVFVDENEDEFDLAAGIKQWIASDEGKGYMPARGAQGSGAEPNRIASKNNGSNKHKPSKQEMGLQLMRMLRT